MAYPVDPIRAAVEAVYPTVRSLGVYNRRPIAGTSIWSQHSWGNAWDIRPPATDRYQVVSSTRKNTLDKVYATLVKWRKEGRTFGGKKIGTILWRVRAHYDHIHVEAAPKFTGTPPVLNIWKEDMAALQVEDLQRALVKAGYDIGTFGPKNDGVDGDYGPKTESALVDALRPTVVPGGKDTWARNQIEAIKIRLNKAKVTI